MIYTRMTKKAMIIAYNAHKDQVDRNNVPYIFHPIHLAEQMDSEKAVIIALLHDVFEDTDLTLDVLEKEGFAFDVIEALALLTRKDGVAYFDYICQIKQSSNTYAKLVKLEDLRHNVDISRLDYVKKDDLVRIEKYSKAIAILEK